MAERNINGMRAQNWKPADTGVIQSAQVKSKKDNIELFEQIKLIVSEAVRTLRGDASDDKYRYIVDLIMMRISALLHGKLEDSSQQLRDDIVSHIDETVASLRDQYDDSAEDEEDETGEIDLTQLTNEILDSISEDLEALRESVIDASESAAGEKESTEVKPSASQETEKPDEGAEEREIPEKPQDGEKPAAPAVEEGADAKQVEVRTKLIGQINEKLDSIYNLINIPIKQLSKKPEKKSAVQQVGKKHIEKIIKLINVQSAKIEQIQARVSKKVKVKQPVQPPSNAKKTRKQLDAIGFIIETKVKDLMVKVEESYGKQEDIYKLIKKQFDKLEKQLSKKTSMSDILLGLGIVAGILIALFWDKIKAFLGGIDFNKIFNSLISNEKILSMITTGWNMLKSSMSSIFKSLISAPVKMLVDKFKRAYEVLTSWTKDVWSWITGKTKETEQAQDENEKKAEQNATEKMDKHFSDLDGNLNKGLQESNNIINENNRKLNERIENVTNDANEKTDNLQAKFNEDVEKTEKTTSAAVEQVNQNVEQVNSEVAQQAQQINETTLPQMQSGLDGEIEGSVKSIEGKCDSQIQRAEGNMDKQLAAIEEKAKAEGAPTSATPDTLKKLEANAESNGADLGKSAEAGPKQSDKVASVKTEDGSILYGDADKMKDGQANVEGVSNIQNNTYTVNNENNTADIQQTNANITNQLTVKGNQPNINRDTYKEYVDIIKHATDIETSMTKSTSLLKGIQDSVSRYFKELNGIARSQGGSTDGKAAPDKTGDNQGVTIVQANQQTSILQAENK